MSENALDLLYGLIIEDGREWGEAAADFQKEDAQAILCNDRPDPTWHFLTRARGGSKSTDVAGMSIAYLHEDAPPLANGHIVAASTEQAAIIIDAAAGLIARTPGMDNALVVESMRIIGPNGAWIRVLAQSDSGSWGLRSHWLVCDEFCQWPETRGAKRVWDAIRTAAPKIPNCRLVVMSSAGEPSHWSHQVIKDCRADVMWRVHEVPGPVPWLDPEQLASLEGSLLPSAYDRLILNIWSESEDRAISPDDYELAQREGFAWGAAPAGIKGGGMRLRHPEPGVKYRCAVDVGTKSDATVITVGHKEPITELGPRGPQKVVVDHIERWQGSKKHPVQITPVRLRVAELSKEYNRARVSADPNQFIGTLQDLNREGVRAQEWTFSASSVGLIATALVQTFRNRLIEVPHSRVLQDELLSVRLRESAPGVTRLDHDRGAHDDQAVTIGLLCHLLLDKSGGVGANFRQFMEQDMEKQALIPREVRAAAAAERHQARTISDRRRAIRAERAREKKRCLHRWSPDRSHCMFCDSTPEDVMEASVAPGERRREVG